MLRDISECLLATSKTSMFVSNFRGISRLVSAFMTLRRL